MEYIDFLRNKTTKVLNNGFKPKNINTKLYEFQQYIVDIACNKGRFGIFSGTGTGKTAMQCEIANQYLMVHNKPVIIFAPLAVSTATRYFTNQSQALSTLLPTPKHILNQYLVPQALNTNKYQN